MIRIQTFIDWDMPEERRVFFSKGLPGTLLLIAFWDARTVIVRFGVPLKKWWKK